MEQGLEVAKILFSFFLFFFHEKKKVLDEGGACVGKYDIQGGHKISGESLSVVDSSVSSQWWRHELDSMYWKSRPCSTVISLTLPVVNQAACASP